MPESEKEQLLWPIVHKLQIIEQQLLQERPVLAYKAALELKQHLAKELGLSFQADYDLRK